MQRLLNEEHRAGHLKIPDVDEAFEILMGLLLRDLQVRVLIGAAPAPNKAELKHRAEVAVDAFLRLHAA